MDKKQLTEEQQRCKDWLIQNNHREPTEKDFLTYVQAGQKRKHHREVKGPFLEDVHYAWRYKLYKND